jgi:hypothetical protein
MTLNVLIKLWLCLRQFLNVSSRKVARSAEMFMVCLMNQIGIFLADMEAVHSDASSAAVRSSVVICVC